MSISFTSGSLTVVAAGDAPVSFVDDVVTNTRHSLEPGTARSLPPKAAGGDEGEGWEPTSLPPAAKLEKDGKGWEPPRMPRVDPSIKLVAKNASQLEVPPDALDTLGSGGRVTVQLLETDTLNLSHLSGLAEAARSNPGQVVVELHGDG